MWPVTLFSNGATRSFWAPQKHPLPNHTHLQSSCLQPHILIARALFTALGYDGASCLQLPCLLLKACCSNPARAVVGIGGNHTLQQQTGLGLGGAGGEGG